MKDFLISPLTKKLIVRFSNKTVDLPLDVQKKIDTYWDELLQSGKTYKRGEIFTVTKKGSFDDRLEILVEKTDYAHYLYCQNIDTLEEYGVHIIHTAALVETSDNKTLFGKMGEHTSRAGIYQLCGGGIDNDDLKDGVFDFEHNITKELQEELGIDVNDKQRVGTFELAYLKEGGPTDKMTVVYRVILNETSEQCMAQYDAFVRQLQANGETEEFGEIVALDRNKISFDNFFNQEGIKLDEYMKPLFDYLAQEAK
jgi:8-oxo-dGTP pyrophosphatase MutT (NUDIX family)